MATEGEERFPTLSPNGRWLAYRSNEGGTHEVWVRPFPGVNDGRWQVTFLMIRVMRSFRPGEKVDDNSGGRLVLVQNWVEELKARVPR